MKSLVGVLCAVLLLGSCKSDSPSSNGDDSDRCVDGDSDCGKQCDSKHACPAGLFCDHLECVKECSASHADSCGDDQHCDAHGQCVDGDAPGDDDDSKDPADSGGSGSDGSGGAGGSDDPKRDGGPNKPDAAPVCAPTKVQATRIIPTVIMIVDQSVSMNEAFGDDTRWNTLRDFLLGEPKGLIADLQDQVRFGLALYSAVSNEDGAGPLPVGECPVVSTVEPDFDNFDAIADVYRDAEPIDDGPTGDSIEKLIDQLGLASKDTDVGTNTVFVLATDGEPDRCEELDPPTMEAKQESLQAVTHAFELGIRTYVISVGGEVAEDHQQELANAGLGVMPGTHDAEYWRAGDDASLRAALSAIVSGELGCEIALDARIPEGKECDGTVTLNGADLECNGPDGWELVDGSHIKLVGDACDELKDSVKGHENVVLEASFPCAFPE